MFPWLHAARTPNPTSEIAFDFGMTDLEERLRSAEGEQVRANWIARCVAIDSELRETMRAGVSPQDFQNLRAMREALAHARKIVTAFH